MTDTPEHAKNKTFGPADFLEICRETRALRDKLVDEASSVPEMMAIPFIFITQAEEMIESLRQAEVEVDFLTAKLASVRKAQRLP